MKTFAFIDRQELPALLEYGIQIGSNDRPTPGDTNRWAPGFWMTTYPHPEIMEVRNEELFLQLFPGKSHTRSRQGIEIFAFVGAVRIEFRLRKDQVRSGGFSDFESPEDHHYWYAPEVANLVDELRLHWVVAAKSITPNQIVRADVWIEREKEWQEIGLARQHALPARLSVACGSAQHPPSELSSGAPAVHRALFIDDWDDAAEQSVA